VFVPVKPFQPSIIFAGKAGAYPSEVPFRLLASPTNIILHWKSLPETKTLVFFYKNPYIYAKNIHEIDPCPKL
jgi:hypothetical protein